MKNNILIQTKVWAAANKEKGQYLEYGMLYLKIEWIRNFSTTKNVV